MLRDDFSSLGSAGLSREDKKVLVREKGVLLEELEAVSPHLGDQLFFGDLHLGRRPRCCFSPRPSLTFLLKFPGSYTLDTLLFSLIL